MAFANLVGDGGNLIVVDLLFTMVFSLSAEQGLQKLEQQQGIIQGSELSMLFFSLYTHHPMSKHLDTINNHVLKYADDIYIYGSID